MDMSVRDLLAGSLNLAKSQAFAEMANISRKAMRLMKHDMRSLHENYPLCHKKCPLFKKMLCFFKSSADQKVCWETKIGNMRQFKETQTGCIAKGCCDACSGCKNFKQCAMKLENREDLKAKQPEMKK